MNLKFAGNQEIQHSYEEQTGLKKLGYLLKSAEKKNNQFIDNKCDQWHIVCLCSLDFYIY